MICTLTARRLKPGAFDAFREAFEKAGIEDVPEDIVKRWSRVYVCRDVTDENVALTFGFFEGTLEGSARSSRDPKHGLRAERCRRTSRRCCSTAPTTCSRRSSPSQEAGSDPERYSRGDASRSSPGRPGPAGKTCTHRFAEHRLDHNESRPRGADGYA
jgi:hypothetical protein